MRGWFKNKGSNIIETTFDRNYFLTDDIIQSKTVVDNRRCLDECSKLIIKLNRTIAATGSNGFVFTAI